MTTRQTGRPLGAASSLLAFLVVLALPGAASATIDEFVLEALDSDDVTLREQIGDNLGDTEHLISIEDCEAYAGAKLEVKWSASDLTLGTATVTYGIAMSNELGGDCDALTPALTDDQDDPDCFVHTVETEYDGGTEKFEVDFDRLMGPCDSSTEDVSTIYVVMDTDDDAHTGFPANERIEFTIDLLAPDPPTLTSVEGGDTRLELTWEDDGAEGGTTYTVYYSDSAFSDKDATGVTALTEVEGTSYAIEDSSLVNGSTYYVRMSATDKAGNEGDISTQMTGVPIETSDFWESYTEAGGTDPGGFCFIATAAWGSPMGAELDTLRAFRDQVLAPTAAGQAFVAHYYRWGRFAAAFIADKPALRAATRVALVPLVWLAQLTTTDPLTRWSMLLGLILAARLVRRWRALAGPTARPMTREAA